MADSALRPAAQGPFLKLRGLELSDIPGPDAPVEAVQPFLLALLQEAQNIANSVDAHYADPTGDKVWKSRGAKKYNSSATGGPDGIDVDLLVSNVVVRPELVASQGTMPVPAAAAASASGGDDNASQAMSAANSNTDSGAAAASNKGSEAKGQAQQNRSIKQLLHRKKSQDTAESWACRYSVHNDRATPGTGSWAEFVRYMKDEHVRTEEDMTATVMATNVAVEWPSARSVPASDLRDIDRGHGPWGDFTLAVVEMKHDLRSWPLQPRVFPVLQMSCRSIGAATPPEIFVISVPVKKWRDYALPNGSKKLADDPKVVLGSYVSVERFRLLSGAATAEGNNDQMASNNNAVPARSEASAAAREATVAPNSDAAPSRIEWIMATASHARGVLPLFLQTPVVPKKIADDVVFFTKWLSDQRASAAAVSHAEGDVVNSSGVSMSAPPDNQA